MELEISRVLGIDENGFGPVLGPLIVTGILMYFEGDPFDMRVDFFPMSFKDSKKIFRRSISSYSIGEILAHQLLQIRGLKPKSFYELLSDFGFDSNLEEERVLYPDFKLPLWAREIREYDLNSEMERRGMRVIDFKVDIVTPKKFNEELKEFESKFKLDFHHFVRIMHHFEGKFEVGLLGKIGGTTRYSNLFEEERFKYEIIKEKRGISSYRVELKESKISLHFIMNGDELYIPIILASVLGKYVRELFMYSLNLLVGKKDPVPWASGYRHDGKTWVLKELIKDKFPNLDEKFFVRMK